MVPNPCRAAARPSRSKAQTGSGAQPSEPLEQLLPGGCGGWGELFLAPLPSHLAGLLFQLSPPHKGRVSLPNGMGPSWDTKLQKRVQQKKFGNLWARAHLAPLKQADLHSLSTGCPLAHPVPNTHPTFLHTLLLTQPVSLQHSCTHSDCKLPVGSVPAERSLNTPHALCLSQQDILHLEHLGVPRKAPTLLQNRPAQRVCLMSLTAPVQAPNPAACHQTRETGSQLGALSLLYPPQAKSHWAEAKRMQVQQKGAACV